MFYVPSISSITIGIMASVITVFVQLALATSLEPCGLPFMALPFCLAVLAFIVIQGTTSNVISVPLSSMTTPEDHLNRVSKLSSGFELLYGAIKSSAYKGDSKKISLLSRNSRSIRQMTTALSEYDDAVHGESKKILPSISFRMSVAMKNSVFGSEEKDSYAQMFHSIDTEGDYEITSVQFRNFLKSVGLSDASGLDFACKSFQLMDLDKSGNIGECKSWELRYA